MGPREGRDSGSPWLPDDEPNSLPPVVPDEPEPDEVGASTPLEPDEENTLPPVVPDEPTALPSDEPNSLPPVVPDEARSVSPDVPDEPNSLPPVVPDEAELETRALPTVVPVATRPDEGVLEDDDLASLPPDEPGEIDPDEVDVATRADEESPPDVRVFVDTDERAATASERPVVPDEDASGAPPEPPSGWAILGRALKPRATRAQIVAGILCAVLGFAVVAQVRQSGETDLAGMRQGDLVRILDETTNRGDALQREAADLTRERDDLLSGSDRRQAALDALRRSAETQGILAGRLPAEGPGVIVTLTETDRFIKPNTMLNMLEEMRNAGAEAIQLNDQRITASSAFTGTGGAIVLDGVELTSPYEWIAIGDPDIIAPALQIPGGAMAQVRNNGGKGSVDRYDLVEVDAVRVVPDPVYATPVPPQGD